MSHSLGTLEAARDPRTSLDLAQCHAPALFRLLMLRLQRAPLVMRRSLARGHRYGGLEILHSHHQDTYWNTSLPERSQVGVMRDSTTIKYFQRELGKF